MNEQAIKELINSENLSAIMAHYEKEIGRSLSKKIEAFLTFRFQNKTFEFWSDSLYLGVIETYEEVFDIEIDEPFSGIYIGNISGFEYYLMLETGDIVSFHHDDTSTIGADLFTKRSTPSSFNKKLIKQYGARKIDSFMKLVSGLLNQEYKCFSDIDDVDLLELIQESYGLTRKQLEAVLQTRGFTPIACSSMDDFNQALKAFDRSRSSEETVKSHENYLNRRSKRIKKIPSKGINYEAIESMDLSGNPKIDWYHDDTWAALKKFKNLKYLNLENNNLESIPTQVAELKNLKRLVLRGNPIHADMNYKWSSLGFLNHLDLRWTEVRRSESENIKTLVDQLPNTIVPIEFDYYEDAYNNISAYFPSKHSYPVDGYSNEELFFLLREEEYEDEIEKMSDALLKAYDEHFKNIDFLTLNKDSSVLGRKSSYPDVVQRHDHFRGLIIKDEIDKLPDHVLGLENLEALEIFIEGKNIEKVVAQLSTLKNLKNLSLSLWCVDEELGKIPKAFSQLKLQTLEIHFRGEDYIPKQLCEAIGQMENLENLSLNKTNDFESFKPLTNLKNLKTFHLTCGTDKSDINALFKVLKELPNLEHVLLESGTSYTDYLSDDICDCKNMKSLSFYTSLGIKEVPKNFHQLNKLEFLDIRRLKITDDEKIDLVVNMPECNVVWDEY